MNDGLILCWKNISYYVTLKQKSFWSSNSIKKIKLLHNVSGFIKAGELSAILGPSGAGKTTLLAAISQRLSGENLIYFNDNIPNEIITRNIFGDITLNGRPVDNDLMLKVAGFVPQFDLSIETLTVKEHIHFMALMKMDKRVSRVQRNRIIKTILEDLGLMFCSSTVLSKLSGGERRRVSLAVQLLTDPPILFCDEPTTGLDSYTATTVITLLKQLAAKGKAIVCTVHQPTSGIFELFDSVTLLIPGGKLAYFGSVIDTSNYFSTIGLNFPVAYNVAEFLIKQLCALSDVLNEKFLKSVAFIKMHKEIENVNKAINNNQLIFGMEEKFLKFYSVQKISQKTQLKWLVWRSYLDTIRTSQKLLLRLFMFICTAFLISIPYSKMKLNQEGIQNFQGLNYSIITEVVFANTYAVLHTFPEEIPILLREISSGVYKPAPYYISKILILLPRVLMETILFCFIIYTIAGFGENIHDFIILTFPVVLSAIVSTAYGCCVSSMFEDISTATLLTVPIDFISYTFSGIFLQLASVPIYLSWIKYISRFYYALEAISILTWSHVEEIPCSLNVDIPCISDGKEVLIMYGYESSKLFLDIIGLLLMFVILHIVGFIFLRIRSKKQAIY